jgi:hypothetical protein
MNNKEIERAINILQKNIKINQEYLETVSEYSETVQEHEFTKEDRKNAEEEIYICNKIIQNLEKQYKSTVLLTTRIDNKALEKYFSDKILGRDANFKTNHSFPDVINKKLTKIEIKIFKICLNMVSRLFLKAIERSLLEEEKINE